jgi:CRP-like cAMP-binding protein
MPRTTSAAQLASTEICRGLSAAEIEALYLVSEDVVLGAGQVLFPEGSPGEAAFVVLTGEVEVLKKDKAGQERSLARLGSGAVLGEMSLIRPDAKRSAAARTTAACTFLKVPGPAFQGLLTQGNVGALKVVHNFARVLSKRLAAVDERVVELLGRTDGGKREELGDFQKLLTNWSF